MREYKKDKQVTLNIYKIKNHTKRGRQNIIQ
jgi:hypothetical protein